MHTLKHQTQVHFMVPPLCPDTNAIIIRIVTRQEEFSLQFLPNSRVAGHLLPLCWKYEEHLQCLIQQSKLQNWKTKKTRTKTEQLLWSSEFTYLLTCRSHPPTCFYHLPEYILKSICWDMKRDGKVEEYKLINLKILITDIQNTKYIIYSRFPFISRKCFVSLIIFIWTATANIFLHNLTPV